MVEILCDVSPSKRETGTLLAEPPSFSAAENAERVKRRE